MVLSRAATFVLLVFLIDSALCQSSSNDTLEITTLRPSSPLELETTISPIDDQIIEITTLEPSSTLEQETTVSPIEDRINNSQINSTSEAEAILSCGSVTSNNGTVKSKRETYEANFSLKAIQRALEDAFPGNDEKQLESMSRCIYNATVEVEKFLSDLLASVKGDNNNSNSKSDTSEDNKKPAVNQQLDAIQKASLSIQSVFNSPDIQKELTGLLKSLVNIEKFNKDVSDIIDKLKDILDDVSKKLRENSSSNSQNTSKVEESVDEAEARPIDSDDDEPIVEDEDVLEPAKVSRDAPKFNCSSPLQYAIKVLSMDQDTDKCGAKTADPAQQCPCVTLLVEPSGSSSQRGQSKC
ncbi:unnamed protein product [Trichogramma brassicae]|uniref:Uncharacterized protein n=1 Tax=Trichogramma brassicae TaxID=86971 RepID=A0A6H5IMM7_9HYME|nr:unnamed protein product [Trichogramma brassicae]